MSDNYISQFSPWCDSGIDDASCLSTSSNDGTVCSVGKTTIFSKTGDTYATESSKVPLLNFGSLVNKSSVWSHFVVSMDNDGSIKH